MKLDIRDVLVFGGYGLILVGLWGITESPWVLCAATGALMFIIGISAVFKGKG